MARSPMGPRIRHLALLGNFLPRKCGIATFTTDTYTALAERYPGIQVDVYAMDDLPGQYAYPPQVTGSIAQNDRSAYLEAARKIDPGYLTAPTEDYGPSLSSLENYKKTQKPAPVPPGWTPPQPPAAPMPPPMPPRP